LTFNSWFHGFDGIAAGSRSSGLSGAFAPRQLLGQFGIRACTTWLGGVNLPATSTTSDTATLAISSM